MSRADQAEIRMRIVLDQPVDGLLYSLQSKDDGPLDPKRSAGGEPLAFDFPVRIAPGPKFFGDQVRREGPERRFVYLRVGQSAGDCASPWNGRIKVDIHDIPQDLLDRAVSGGGVAEITINGTGKAGKPALATIKRTKLALASS